MNMRRLKMGLNTVLGLKKQGFFIPYRYAGSPSPLANRTHYPAILSQMQDSTEKQAQFLGEMSAYSDQFASFGKTPPPEPRWEQDWFPRMDGAAAYKMVRDTAPEHIIEVGSGHSTRFMARAIKDGGLKTSFTAIDPAPRADISKLDVKILNKTVQEVDPTLFDLLQPNDILFIDSSHIAMPGTDVDMLFLDILPRLPAGVNVHIHDIFLPLSYPESWAWRGYNEQQIVAPLLTSGGFELLFSSQFVFTEMKDILHNSKLADIPMLPGAMETSLWLRKIT